MKGLGEMDFPELRDTTMDRGSRSLLQVSVEQASLADEVCSILMGDDVEQRRLSSRRTLRTCGSSISDRIDGGSGVVESDDLSTQNGGLTRDAAEVELAIQVQEMDPARKVRGTAVLETGQGRSSGAIEPIEIQEEMERSFLEYSMSVIVVARPSGRS